MAGNLWSCETELGSSRYANALVGVGGEGCEAGRSRVVIVPRSVINRVRPSEWCVGRPVVVGARCKLRVGGGMRWRGRRGHVNVRRRRGFKPRCKDNCHTRVTCWGWGL
jgi:hypothetical protein